MMWFPRVWWIVSLIPVMVSTETRAAQIVACEVRIDGEQVYSMTLEESRERTEYWEGDFTAELPSSNLSVGPHRVEVRCQGDNGVWCRRQAQWIRVGGEVCLMAAEYFVDVDPGQGNGTPIPLPADGAWDCQVDEEIVLQRVSDDLEPGYHILYVRFLDSDGDWGITRETQFYVAEPLYIVAAEWTTDADCTPGEGNPMSAADGAFDEAAEELIADNVDSAALGDVGQTVRVYVRVQDNLGRWSTRQGLMDYIWYGNEEPGNAAGEWVCDPDRAWPPEDEQDSWGWVIIGPACTAQQFGDYDFDCVIDLDDYAATYVGCEGVPMHGCFFGPAVGYGMQCKIFDFDADGDVDLRDFAGFQGAFRQP